MRKLDLIIENIRDEYMINLLEEGETTELETLKTKKFLNENLNRIRKMLIEEGALEGVKQHLGDNWGKYLAAAGGAGLGMHGADVAGIDAEQAGQIAGDVGEMAATGDPAQMAMAGAGAAGIPPALVGAGAGDLAGQAAQAIGGAADAAGEAIGGAADAVGQFATDAAGNIMDAAGNVVGNVQDLMAQVQG